MKTLPGYDAWKTTPPDELPETEWECRECNSWSEAQAQSVELYGKDLHLDCALQIIGRDWHRLMSRPEDLQDALWIIQTAAVEAKRRLR